jgi:hypothetical protein
MDAASVVLLMLIFAAFVIAIFVLRFSRAKSILEQWAETNGYQLVSRKYRWLGGAFWWRKSKSQEVYYVTVRTSNGQIRRGWVRCGSWFCGILSDQADVKWDD